MNKITESDSLYNGLENWSVSELVNAINQEDQKVALAVQEQLPQITKFIEEAVIRMKNGARLFYIGAGTSGRIGILDASECPPTFGVPHDLVNGIIAGGDSAIRKAVENAEDDREQAWKDLLNHAISENDCLVGIAASGTTPYVLGGIEQANKNNILTAGISCNPDSPLSKLAQHAITPIVGPEFVTGSSRMKAGTAQKMILNIISTTIMIQLGRVKGNKMVDMQLSNSKLVDRGTKMIMNQLNIPYEEANDLLLKFGSVRQAIEHYTK